MKNDLRIIVQKVKAKDLKPGDLFSTEGESYWSKMRFTHRLSIGEKIYIRTERDCPEDQKETDIYKITILKDYEQN